MMCPCFSYESFFKCGEAALDAVNRRGKSIKCRVTCTPIVATNKERHGTNLILEEIEEK